MFSTKYMFYSTKTPEMNWLSHCYANNINNNFESKHIFYIMDTRAFKHMVNDKQLYYYPYIILLLQLWSVFVVNVEYHSSTKLYILIHVVH